MKTIKHIAIMYDEFDDLWCSRVKRLFCYDLQYVRSLVEKTYMCFVTVILSLILLVFNVDLVRGDELQTSDISQEDEFVEITSPLTTKQLVPHSFADIVEPLLPAVVNISTIEYSNDKSASTEKSPSNEKKTFDWINEFLERFNIPINLEEVDPNQRTVPIGSGFIIDASGYIVTNCHVIANAERLSVKLADNTELPAKVIGTDTKTDLALLKVDSETPLPFVKFGDSSKARVGDWIIAIGNPFGNLGGTVTAGIISSKGRDIDIDSHNIIDNFIQTDAAINSGNSGGPMFNLAQEVIGVNTAIFSPVSINVGIGFAIPSNTAKSIIERLKKDGKVSRGRLGVIIQDLNDEIVEGFDLKDNSGVLVTRVQKNSSGELIGLKQGDVITKFAGQVVKNTKKLRIIVAQTPIEQEIKILVVRDGQDIELAGKIMPDDDEISNASSQSSPVAVTTEDLVKVSFVKNGITFSNLTSELRDKFLISSDKSGIIITQIEAEGSGLRVGDLIIAVNKEDVDDIKLLEKLYEEAKDAKKHNILLLVDRGTSSVFVAFPVE